VCGSPKLIAACHVLHRLILPRHPPCALSSLFIEFTRTQKPTPRTRSISSPCYYPKDTQQLNLQHCAETTRTLKAQPCSYIYPIYSVVKLHKRIALARPGANLARTRLRPRLRLSPQPHPALRFIFRKGMVELTGIEPMTSCLQSRRSPN
jgi:hypothetical protein